MWLFQKRTPGDVAINVLAVEEEWHMEDLKQEVNKIAIQATA